ncbi:hypothetical protein pEaSNUABM50_00058 [Erwinia phage pEa_SNUABM_50]|uniref:Uncharacterized protein n=4 Tax=Eneladusvirus BF TaxID=2560751 RepID=A0A7L8ZM77_9CAUD|nr:hypothetical protein FDH34_gp060 [Serratia phage BF]QOI70998.1 hypothetical protein pEaSNUABM12_00060 [Erwinia phage pEa_SNUABM_12]QOI71543.1 hypothetical protein pEaSNUABM47_00059 [Erwinia phage pEa_SNUABM_47]QOI72082.1 hypothetical protein pEaSNUABM50_00058 [Erwinia phage pEa_SNUABM_50]QXO11207.1 hypothetical protein pEaSNUABM19_00061 [Erwinia phage pEa_SNUABM_19]QXO11755.1 hypothetical protein pEaSNUABM44_00059 [Erwinia phage pEa_SNUABM_44]QXO12306.1 hypothetical protein pEaSNUABM49_000
MLSIKDLITCQRTWDDKIRTIANMIDPKLLSILSYEDIFNDKYKDDTLQEKYTEIVYPLIVEYKKEFKELRDKYLLDYINDMGNVLDSLGYYVDSGEEAGNVLDSITNDFIPCVEIEHVWNYVYNELQIDIHRPFWVRSGYSLVGNNEYVSVESNSSPSKFIEYNRNKFNRSYGEKRIDIFKRSVRQADELFDYDIHIQPLSKFEDDKLPNNYNDAVRRHLILRHALENQNLIEDNAHYISKITEEGEVQFLVTGYF